MSFYDQSIFYINSSKRITGVDSNFTYQLPLRQDIEYDRVVVLAANIPKTFYQVQAGRNKFTLNESAGSILFTVPIGTYTRQGFVAALSALLTQSSGEGWTYAMTIPNTLTGPESGKFTFTILGNVNSLPVSFVFGEDLIYEQMGFSPNSSYAFTGGSTLVSIHVTNFASETCLFLRSDVCYNHLTQDNVLQEIYTNGVNYNANISFINFQPKRYAKLITKRSQIYQFSLTDEYGNELDLNGVNMVFTLQFFKISKLEGTIEKYIRYQVNKHPVLDEEIENTNLEEDDEN